MTELHRQVQRFYAELWEARHLHAMPDILHGDFTFRGSLGQEKQGHAGFAEYVEFVHRGLGDYRCTIEALVVEAPKAFARMTFSGVHHGEFLGYAPTGENVSWAGSALFTFVDEKISDVWVLGDLWQLHAELERQREKHRNGKDNDL